MNIIRQSIPDVLLIEPRVFEDYRGFFYETINIKSLAEAGIDFTVIQENCAYSKKAGTIRGLHFQNAPTAQAKIIRCVRGAVVDFAIDLRYGSSTYKQYVFAELSEENKKQFYLPRGFAHGVISIVDDTIIEYFADNPYSPSDDRSIRYNDPDINIKWPVDKIIVSEKDGNAPFLKDSDCNFII